MNKINELLQYIEGDAIKEFVNDILVRYREEFLTAPSSHAFHHAYKGGNYLHTKAVTELTLAGCKLYNVNRDIAVAGGILHDIGKCLCYAMSGDEVKQLVADPLHGHFILGNNILKEAYEINPVIGEVVFDRIQNIVLSHHGEISKGFGSIVDPIYLESVLVHHADTMDAFVTQVDEREKTLFVL
jgi:3'-5' exoribonuclease